MKTVYFVRHGESITNSGPVVIGPTAGLTEKGKQQVQEIAARCEKLPIEVILSSTYVRAKETAAVIHERTGKPLEFSELFVERKQPSEEKGLRRDDPRYVAIGVEMRENFAKEGWRHSDEENFDDIKIRVRDILAHLEARTEEHILVVTHGVILRAIIAYVLFGEGLTGREMQNVIRGFETANTGITVLHRQPPDYFESSLPRVDWRVWVWNDHAHLG